MQMLFQYAEAVAGSTEPILVTGETGTGKALMVQAIHTISGRRGDLLVCDVPGLDDHLFADTLFGHCRGAFEGALEERQGLIAKATDGSLLLDEIGDLPGPSQVKLLRLLQDRI